jgi:hypothetical protein
VARQIFLKKVKKSGFSPASRIRHEKNTPKKRYKVTLSPFCAMHRFGAICQKQGIRKNCCNQPCNPEKAQNPYVERICAVFDVFFCCNRLQQAPSKKPIKFNTLRAGYSSYSSYSTF